MDAGGDDAATILLALSLEEKLKDDGFKVVAITCTYGNTALANVERNVMKILTIANRTDVIIAFIISTIIHLSIASTVFIRELIKIDRYPCTLV